ncbi:hypothetical protein BDQ12DRAFT_261124 [Crucibulum laeve]|uniref:Uncharacterized protein n=1 Tax=Crucibulum laeve TaxID=68775 RepID=A0A5C3LS31_9AGAR|nr:hypothetical protein BDQ12DRAFT_261124 [Crucibulum laeve]
MVYVLRLHVRSTCLPSRPMVSFRARPTSVVEVHVNLSPSLPPLASRHTSHTPPYIGESLMCPHSSLDITISLKTPASFLPTRSTCNSSTQTSSME